MKTRIAILLWCLNFIVWSFAAAPPGHTGRHILVTSDADKAAVNASGTLWIARVPANASGSFLSNYTYWYLCEWTTPAMLTEMQNATNAHPNAKLYDATIWTLDAVLSSNDVKRITIDGP